MLCGNNGLSNGPESSYVKSFTEEFHTRPYIVQWRIQRSDKGAKKDEIYVATLGGHLFYD